MKKILIIDDDVYIGDLLQELLSRNNYQIYRCYSGTEALLFLDTMTPDLILLDLMLPGMSGEAVLAKIKAIPVIVLSAKADINDKVELLYLGTADYMTKPFDTRELLARIAVQLRNEPPGHNAALVFKDLTLDPHTYQVHIKKQPVRLTNRICNLKAFDDPPISGQFQINNFRIGLVKRMTHGKLLKGTYQQS